jgi:hypothetical protein
MKKIEWKEKLGDQFSYIEPNQQPALPSQNNNEEWRGSLEDFKEFVFQVRKEARNQGEREGLEKADKILLSVYDKPEAKTMVTIGDFRRTASYYIDQAIKDLNL